MERKKLKFKIKWVFNKIIIKGVKILKRIWNYKVNENKKRGKSKEILEILEIGMEK